MEDLQAQDWANTFLAPTSLTEKRQMPRALPQPELRTGDPRRNDGSYVPNRRTRRSSAPVPLPPRPRDMKSRGNKANRARQGALIASRKSCRPNFYGAPLKEKESRRN